MKKIKVIDYIASLKMRDHDRIRDKILSTIEKSFSDNLIQKDNYYIDSISRLDWNQSTDFERPWVKILLPNFMETVKEFLEEGAYKGDDWKGIILNDLWFQQYRKGDTHGWHAHRDHFTGVYYLEYPKGCSKTEICCPYNLKIKKIDALEGDIVIFPSHWIHRGPPNKSENRKTIVSFNFSLDLNYKFNTDLITSTNAGKPYIFF